MPQNLPSSQKPKQSGIDGRFGLAIGCVSVGIVVFTFAFSILSSDYGVMQECISFNRVYGGVCTPNPLEGLVLILAVIGMISIVFGIVWDVRIHLKNIRILQAEKQQ